MNDFAKGFMGATVPGTVALLPLLNRPSPAKERQSPSSFVDDVQKPINNIPPDIVKSPTVKPPTVKPQHSTAPVSNANFELQLRNQLMQHENKKNRVYRDSKGIPTIGIGFNLQRSDAKKKIESLGLNFEDVKSGKQTMTDVQIYRLFAQDMQVTEKCARKMAPNYDKLPTPVKLVINDLIFNIGPSVMNWKILKGRLAKGDYAGIAESMKKWPWYEDVGGGKYSTHPKRRNFETRGDRLIRLMQEASSQYPPKG